jgi:hypothetical protein
VTNHANGALSVTERRFTDTSANCLLDAVQLVRGQPAPTVAPMPAIVLGAIVAFLLLVGPLSWLRPQVSAVADALVGAADRGIAEALTLVPGVDSHPSVVATVSTIAAVTAPGLVALALAYCAGHAVPAGRRLLVAVLVLAAAGSFFVVPVGSAVALVGLAVITSVMLLSPAGLITSAAMWALAAVIAVSHLSLVWAGTAPTLASATESFGQLSGLDAPELWRATVLVLAVSPFVAVAGIAVRSAK